MNYDLLQFEEHGDSRGTLISLEQYKNIPFEIKRVYFMFDTQEGVRRGFHAHKKLKQVLICTSGECKILLDDGMEKKIIVLDSPNKGLYIESDMWREMYDFTKGAVLMVVASELYDETDYIREYDEFLAYINVKQKQLEG